MTTHSLHAMRVSLLLLLGASIFSVSFAEELCTDGICVSDDGDEQSPPVTTEQYTVAVNSDGSTPNSAGNSPSFTADDFWESIDDVDNVLKKQKNTINPKKDAREILNQLKEKNSERKQDKTNTNNNAAKNPVEITPEMERYFQDLIESGGDHARLSVLSDLLSGTKSSIPVENMPTIILTDKETADEHLRKTWHAGNEEAMKREHIQEAASIDRLRAVFENTLSSTKEGNISDATTAVNMANMIEELFGVEENEFDGDDGMSDHTQMGFGIERNPCPNFEDSGKTGFLVPRMLHGYVDKNGEVMPEENTYQLSANGCSSLGEDSKDKDDFGLWKCCNRHSMCYGLCGSSLRFCERSYSTCMASTCDAIDIGHDEASIIANQEACRQKKKRLRGFSRIFGSEMHSIQHEDACTCVGTEEEADQVHKDFLQDIYQRFGSSKKASNATLHTNLLRKHKGMEAKLWYKLALKYGTEKGFVNFEGSPGADFGKASESKVYTLEQLHEIREAGIQRAIRKLKRKEREQMTKDYDDEISVEDQLTINKLRMATIAVRRKYEDLRENAAPPPIIPRVVDLSEQTML